MHDYYAERIRSWPRHHSQLQPTVYPYYGDYDDGPMPVMQIVRAFHPRKHEHEEYSEGDSDVEKATRAHIQATSEYEKVKEVFDDAKKKLEECEAKVQAATKRLEKAKREWRRYHLYY